MKTVKRLMLNLSLKQKFYIGAIVLIICILAIQHLSANMSENALKKSIGYNSVIIAQEVISKTEKVILSKIDQFQGYSLLFSRESTLAISNMKFEEMTNVNQYIEERDREWLAAPEEKITPFMSEIINNELSKKLKDILEIKDYGLREGGYTLFGEIFITNKFGVNAAQSGKTTDYYQGDEPWWQRARDKEMNIGDIYYDQSARIYALDFAFRIDDKSKGFSGIMKVVTNLQDIIEIIKDVKTGGLSKNNHTRQYTLITHDGRIIYSTKQFNILSKLNNEVMNYLHKDNSLDETFFTGSNEEGKEVLYAHAHFKNLKELGWILIVEQETNEIFCEVIRMRKVLSFITAFIVVTLFMIIVYNILFILKPIKTLERAMEKAGKGLFGTKVNIKNRDEIGNLAKSFNKMTQELEVTTTSKNYLNNIVHSMSDALIVITRKGLINSVNHSACALLKYTEAELIGMHIDTILTDNNKLSHLNSFDGIVEKLVVRNKEVALLSKENKQIKVLFSGVIIDIEEKKSEGILFLAKDISEYKVVEEKLFDMTMMAQAVTDCSKDGIIIADNHASILFWNPAAEKILGYKAKEAIGRHLNTLITPQKNHQAQEETPNDFLQALNGHITNKSIILPAIKKDGSEISIELSQTKLEMMGVWHSVVIIRDITDKKIRDEYLLMLEKALETTQIGFTITKVDGTILYTNEAEAKMHGYDPKEIERKDIGIFAPAKLRYPMTIKKIKELSSWKRESVNLHKDGSSFPVQLMSDILMDDKGNPLALITSCEDISERKKLEMELEQSNKRLETMVEERTGELKKELSIRKSVEEKFEKLSNVLAKGSNDLNKNIDILIKECGELLKGAFVLFIRKEYDITELVAQWHDPENKISGETVEGIIDLNTIEGDEENKIKIINNLSDPPYYHAHHVIEHYQLKSCISCPVYSFSTYIGQVNLFYKQKMDIDENDQNVLQLICSAIGINEERRAILKNMEIAKEKAEEANKVKSNFLSTVSHELRTPLTSILGFSHVIEKDLESQVFSELKEPSVKTKRATKNVRESIEVIKEESERLSRLINNILDLAKIEAGRIEWKEEEVEIKDVFKKALVAVKSLYEQKGIDIKSELNDKEYVGIRGDKDRLIQVVINLFSNAIKFTDKGSITYRIYQEDKMIKCEVEDSGCGIPKDSIDKVFDRFMQIGDVVTDRPLGTGLGLPICKEIIEHHRGRIWAESKEGKGSKFIFQLPTV